MKQTMQVLNMEVNNMQADLNVKMEHLLDMFDKCLNVKSEAELINR